MVCASLFHIGHINVSLLTKQLLWFRIYNLHLVGGRSSKTIIYPSCLYTDSHRRRLHITVQFLLGFLSWSCIMIVLRFCPSFHMLYILFTSLYLLRVCHTSFELDFCVQKIPDRPTLLANFTLLILLKNIRKLINKAILKWFMDLHPKAHGQNLVNYNKISPISLQFR